MIFLFFIWFTETGIWTTSVKIDLLRPLDQGGCDACLGKSILPASKKIFVVVLVAYILVSLPMDVSMRVWVLEPSMNIWDAVMQIFTVVAMGPIAEDTISIEQKHNNCHDQKLVSAHDWAIARTKSDPT